jgi:hypothetical protein
MSLLGLMAPAIAGAQAQSNPPMNNLRITNRAQCAVDSDSPTDTAFLILDGYNAGKLGNSLAKNLGLDDAVMSQDSMKEFRLSITHLTLTIMNKLMTGKLPLLPMNVQNTKLPNYGALVKQCGDKVYCPELGSYLAKIWAVSEKTLPTDADWKSIDPYTSNNFMVTSGSRRLGCYYLKRFSPLQGQLQNSKIDAASLQEMAVAYLEQEKYVTDCYSTDDTLDSRNVALQLDLKISDQDSWNAKGFDYWNSLKIYLSWAWRNTQVPNKVSQRFGQMFKSLALEESIMFIPNGCKSITKPACDSEHLSLNSLRELAKSNNQDADHNALVPTSPDKNLIDRGARSVNDDFLNTRGYQTASEWVDNFRKNFVSTRGSMKNKLQSSVQFMNVLADSMSANDLVEFVKPLALTSTMSSAQRDELYYLCTEVRLAGDKRLDFMKTDIDNIKGLKDMTKALQNSKRGIQDFVGYFDAMSAGILPLCDRLEKTNIWQSANYTVNKNGFNPWAKQLLSIGAPEGDPVPVQTYGAPLLVWNQALGSQPGNVICSSGIDCARGVLKSIVDLYAVATYADAFLPISSMAASPDVFNPYSELKACKIYDPWYQTKRANRVFMTDLASTALFGWNIMPIYIDADYAPAKVTSFQKLVKDGVIKFDPNIDRAKMEASVLADLGPLTGAPCAVSIAPNAKNFNFLAFDGISVNYCDVKSNAGAVSTGANNVTATPNKTRSYCGGCSINFVGVTEGAAVAATSTFNPIKLGIYLFRAINRFVNAKKDPVNVPKSYDVDLSRVADAYRRFGTIPVDCVDQLGQGLRCFKDICEAKAVDFFEKLTGATVSSAYVQNNNRNQDYSYEKTAWVKSDLCNGEVMFKFSCRQDGSGFWTAGQNQIYGWSGNCKQVVEQRRWKK